MNKIIAYTDGGSRGNPGPSAAGICLYDTQKNLLHCEGVYLGKSTNNVAEYSAVVKALMRATQLKAKTIEVFCDSELLVKQIKGSYRVKSPTLKPLHQEVVRLLEAFDAWEFTHVLRGANLEADAMVNQCLDAGTDILIKEAAAQPEGPKLRIGGLISGSGRTLQNIVDHIQRGSIHAELPIVISSRSDVSGNQRMRDAGLPVTIIGRKDYPDIDRFSRAIEERLIAARVDLVLQGGWLCLWKIPTQFHNRVMNIHPALLPSFGGKGMWGPHVHEAVLKAGCKVSGCTVHFCTDEYDQGPILLQRTCPVEPEDTPDTLAARVFGEECIAYPEAVNLFAQGKLSVNPKRAAAAAQT